MRFSTGGYRPERPEVGPLYQLLTTRRARMEGFLLYDFEDRFAGARRTLLGWNASGSVHVEHDVLEDGQQLLHIADSR